MAFSGEKLFNLLATFQIFNYCSLPLRFKTSPNLSGKWEVSSTDAPIPITRFIRTKRNIA